MCGGRGGNRSSARTRGTGAGAGRSGAAAVDAKVQRGTCALILNRKYRRKELLLINRKTIGEHNIQNIVHVKYYANAYGLEKEGKGCF